MTCVYVQMWGVCVGGGVGACVCVCVCVCDCVCVCVGVGVRADVVRDKGGQFDLTLYACL